MKKEKQKFWVVSFSLPFLLFTFLFLISQQPAAAQAAEPFIFLTWRADSSAPADFRGKILPTAYTRISAGVEVISNGKIADLSRATVSWYLDNNLLASGSGLRQITFNAPEIGNTVRDLRVEILGVGDGFLIKTVEIPVVQPEVIIEAPLPERTFSGSQVTLVAKPYFFNFISGVVFDWKINGQEPESRDNSGILQVNLKPNTPQGFKIGVEVTAYNPANALDSATKKISIVFSP